jgi:replication factor A1
MMEGKEGKPSAMVLSSLEVLQQGLEAKIEIPEIHQDRNLSQNRISASASNPEQEKIEEVKVEVQRRDPPRDPPRAQPQQEQPLVQSKFQDNYMPIAALNSYSRDWQIRARVISKQMKDTRNGGKILKLVLNDSDGTQIEGTFFNKAAEAFDPVIDESRVYLFQGGRVTIANKKFSQLSNDH